MHVFINHLLLHRFKADRNSHLLQPLDGRGWITYCSTRQHDVPHPGGRHCPVEGQNPSRSYKSTHMLHQATQEIMRQQIKMLEIF